MGVWDGQAQMLIHLEQRFSHPFLLQWDLWWCFRLATIPLMSGAIIVTHRTACRRPFVSLDLSLDLLMAMVEKVFSQIYVFPNNDAILTAC